MQQVQQSMTEYLVCEVDEVYDKLEDRRKKAAEAKLGECKVKQHDVRCHEESSDTGTEEVNSEAEVAKDNYQVKEDTSNYRTEEKIIWRGNEKRNPDAAVMAAGRDNIFSINLLNVASLHCNH